MGTCAYIRRRSNRKALRWSGPYAIVLVGIVGLNSGLARPEARIDYLSIGE